LYNQIDAALAKVAQLSGGNSFTGDQLITGLLNVQALGVNTFGGTGAGFAEVRAINTTAGANNYAQVTARADVVVAALAAWSSGIAASGFNQPSGVTLSADGPGGLSIVGAHAAGAVRCYTNSAERLRITPTGELLVGGITNPNIGQVLIETDLTAHQGIVFKNTSSANSGNYVIFNNSAGASAGNIAQSGATSVIYGTTSDARLKTDAGVARDLAALRGVVVHDFTWTADGARDRGVFAQEVAALFPRAVLAGTDETTEHGSLARPWMTDYSKFVPDLIAGWQQHDAALADLRAILDRMQTS
jgi:hypothetical protein